MSTLSLTSLPTELLAEIIPHVLPDGFESLALTCKATYKLCIPFIEQHNHLRSQFQKFRYREYSRDPSLSPIKSAFDLIMRIATEPTVAHYIRDADFNHDSWPPRFRVPRLLPDVDDDGPVVRLFANSPYLRQSGLDWKDYYALIREDLKNTHPYYSQHAAVFILTLLPNVKTLKLPVLWKPVGRAEKLLDLIVRKTKQSHFQYDRPSLGQVTRFEIGYKHRFELDKAVPFLILSQLRSFCGHNGEVIGDISMPLTSKDPYPHTGETLETAYLLSCCIDEVAIASFLKNTPRLKMLTYSHSTRGDSNRQDWNICKFATAIEREAGSHLEELSISIQNLHGSITPGKASMRGFQRLQKLEFPLDIAMCHFTDAASQAATSNGGLTGQGLNNFEPIINDLVPTSVSQLSLVSGGKNHHDKALKAMFRDFAARKDSQLPALKEIYLTCPVNPSADDVYKEECAKLAVETENAGVVLHVLNSLSEPTINWNWAW